MSGSNDSPVASTSKQKRSSTACLPCRRGRRKCLQEIEGVLPCTSCKTHNRTDLCVLASAGTSRQDREPKGLRTIHKRPKSEDESSQPPEPPPPPPPAPPAVYRSRYDDDRPSSVPSTSYSSGSSSTAFNSNPPPPSHPPVHPAQFSVAANLDDAYGLPPLPIIMEGCEAYFSGYFQLGFLNRPAFMHQVATDVHSINPFLLLGILSVSARFTPSLVERYGGRKQAVDAVLGRAQAMMMSEMISPSLERVQAIYLLSLSDWGKGNGHRSRLLFSMALQSLTPLFALKAPSEADNANTVAEMIKLGEDDPTAGPIETEVRRRTWWFLNLTSNSLNVSASTPLILDPVKTRIPLPSHEDDFNFGTLSTPPTYFPGSIYNVPGMERDPRGVSLLAVLLTIFVIWGTTSRGLCGISDESRREQDRSRVLPWEPHSLLETQLRELTYWLGMLSNKQKWSVTNLLAYKSVNLDLVRYFKDFLRRAATYGSTLQSLFSIFANYHLNHIALRRQYLPTLIKALHPFARPEDAAYEGHMPPTGLEYWRQMASSMVQHALDTIELQSVVKKVRSVGIGGSPYMAFALYLSGTIVNYLRCCPWLCPVQAPLAQSALATALEILNEISDVWPMSQRWYSTLVAQSAISPIDVSAAERATEQANNDLHLDRSVGFFRQFAAVATSAAGQIPDSLAAASTLAQLGNGTPTTEPVDLDGTQYDHYGYSNGNGSEAPYLSALQLGDSLDPFQLDLGSFLQGGSFQFEYGSSHVHT